MASKKDAAGEGQPVNVFRPVSRVVGRNCKKLPYRMYGAKSVVIGDIVYVGGGYTAHEDGINNVVLKYIVKDDTWLVLPPCTVTLFGLAAVNGRLVTIGGRDILSEGKPTAACFEFSPETDSWARSSLIPNLPKPRYGVGCTSDDQRIITFGGITEEDGECFQLHIFSVDKKQWLDGCFIPDLKGNIPRIFSMQQSLWPGDEDKECGLPVTSSRLQALGQTRPTRQNRLRLQAVQVPKPVDTSTCTWGVIIDDHLFIKLPGMDIVHALVSSICDREVPDFERDDDEASTGLDEPWPSLGASLPCKVSESDSITWQHLTTCPTGSSPLINLGGCLACIGDEESQRLRTVYMFLASTQAWVPFCKLPRHGIYKYSCSAVLSNGDVLIIGGRDDDSISNAVVRVRLM